MKETDRLHPSSPYSAAKAAGDLFRHTRAPRRQPRSPAAPTPTANQYPEKFIPLFVTNALDGEQLPLYGDGRQVRDWLFVEDHCSGIERVLREGAPGEIYNVGGGDEVENMTVAERIIESPAPPRPAPPRRRPPRPRPPLLARHDEARGSRLGAADDVRARAGGAPVLVPGPPRMVGADQVGRVPRRTYERQYADRLRERNVSLSSVAPA